MKRDSSEIIDILSSLSDRYGLGRVSSRLAKYVYHHTDVQNAAKILDTDRLLCRSELERRGEMPVDNASRTIIANTNSSVKDFVRLYFRPQTPTQYRNEGIRPITERWEGAHSPIPVFLLFDSASVLTRDETLFSERNLARAGNVRLCSTAQDLAAFDFAKIFHFGGLGRYSAEIKQEIISCRNAEVVIPFEMDLSGLKLIVCRSPAEKETLVNLLSPVAFELWAPRIIVDTKADLFFRKWTFVQSASLYSQYATFQFSPETITPGPFRMTIEATGHRRLQAIVEQFAANRLIRFNLTDEMSSYRISVTLDDSLAYLGVFDEGQEIPF